MNYYKARDLRKYHPYKKKDRGCPPQQLSIYSSSPKSNRTSDFYGNHFSTL